MLLPKEHGAYAQLLYPLVTGLVVARGTGPAWAMASAAVAAFLAHEPIVVLRGERGARARRERHVRARWGLGVALLLGIGAGVTALATTPASARWSYVVPLLPAAIFGVALARDAEKSIAGEFSAALAFSTIPAPMCVAAGLPTPVAFAVTLPFCLLFATTTGLVRAIVVSTRGGGDAADAARTRGVTLAVALFVVGLTVGGAWSGLWSWVVVAVEVPSVVSGSLLAVAPPSATALRRVGWTIVVVATITAALAATAGRSGAFRATRLAVPTSPLAR